MTQRVISKSLLNEEFITLNQELINKEFITLNKFQHSSPWTEF